VYKASAGAGKTYRLALEYIALALAEEQASGFAHILAVTFTNKATAEMKDRILAYLYDVAHEGMEESFISDLCAELSLTRQEVKLRAGKVLRAIIHDYDHFHVETIDAFLQSLLTNLAYELNLTRGFSVELETRDTVSRAVDRLFLSANRPDRVKRNIPALLERFMEDNLAEGKGWGIAKDIKEFAGKNLFREIYLQHEAEISQALSDTAKINSFLTTLQEEKKRCEDHLSLAGEALQRAAEELLGDETYNKTALKTICTFARNAATGGGLPEIKTTLLKVIDDPTALIRKSKGSPAGGTSIAEQISENVGRFTELAKKEYQVLNTINLTLAEMMPLRLLNEVGREVSDICRETNAFMLALTPDLFKKMVRGDDSSFVFERAGTTFQHVMIDEFQDTSHMQWDIFKNLLLENIAKGEENLIVGDVKQSIYRWRGGDWNILHGVDTEMKNTGSVEICSLETNFRSKEQIVNFNNAFFTESAKFIDELNATDNAEATHLVADIYKEVVQRLKPAGARGGYVRVALNGEETATEDVLDELHERIERLHVEAGIAYSDMVILVRWNSETAKIIDHYTEHYPQDISHYTSDEAFWLSASPAVMLLISTLRYLSSPEENTLAAACARSHYRQLLEAVGEDAAKANFDVLSLLAERDALLAMPLLELCMRLMRHFGLPSLETRGAGQTAYLYAFQDLVLNYLDGHSSCVDDFLDYCDTVLPGKAITADVTDAVRIMTIHKAKGLQRHTVFVPFCDWNFFRKNNTDVLWCDTGEISPELGKLSTQLTALPIVPITQSSENRLKGSGYATTFNRERRDVRIDRLNELYVAFTRAEENLYIWATPSGKDKANNMGDVLKHFLEDRKANEQEESIFSFGTPPCREALPSAEQVPSMKKLKAIHDLTDLATDVSNTCSPLRLSENAPGAVFRQSNEAARFVRAMDDEGETGENARSAFIDRGNLLHYLFSLIQTSADLDNAFLTARERGLFASTEEEATMKKFVRTRLSDPTAQIWFDGSWQIFAECTLLQKNEAGELQLLRPDRVMKRGNEIVVVDYKTGKYRSEYDEQVRGYIHTLSLMQQARVSGYLWMLADGSVRPVNP